MSKQNLGGPILESVSRSFYLSIRVLPEPLREPIGLAYLLARTSDTIADSTNTPPAERHEHLAAFATMVAGGNRKGLDHLQKSIEPEHPGERVLISRIGACLDWLNTVEFGDRELIRVAMAKIIRGQDLDLARFSDPSEVAALATAAELEEYTYLVAGCVGEFWTDVCLRHLPRYSRIEPAALRKLGIDFGKGLQLVNILRDMPVDLRDGRSYLPADEISPVQILSDSAAASEVFNRWLNRAAELLDAGRTYVNSVCHARVRAACFLPWDLGHETLKLMAARPPLETDEKVKVSRGVVRRSLWRGLMVALGSQAK